MRYTTYSNERRRRIEIAAHRATRQTHFQVFNLRGTSWKSCWCGSWFGHYWNFSGVMRETCARLGCSNAASVGAHVRLADRRSSRRTYIVPLCSACNHWRNDEAMFIDSRTALVSANVSLTCAALD